MITYKLAQVNVQDAMREAQKTHLAQMVKRPQKTRFLSQLSRFAVRYGLIHAR